MQHNRLWLNLAIFGLIKMFDGSIRSKSLFLQINYPVYLLWWSLMLFLPLIVLAVMGC